MKTSVIIPVYNTEKYLEECLQSIVKQTQKEVEIIAIDDGSTDNSKNILLDYAKKNPNMLVYSQKNNKQGSARNNGLRHAAGEYIYFMDSDDYLDTNALEICYYYAKKYRLDAVLFDARSFIDGPMLDSFVPDSFDRRDIIKEREIVYTGREFLQKYMNTVPDTVSPCLMYTSRRFIEENNLFFLEGVFFEDEEYRFKMMLAAKRVMYIPKLLYNRRYRPGSTMTAKYSVNNIVDKILVIKAMNRAVGKYGKVGEKLEKQYIELRLGGLLASCRNIDLGDRELVLDMVLDLIKNIQEVLLVDLDGMYDVLYLYRLFEKVIDVFGENEKIDLYKDIIREKANVLLKNIFSELPLRDESKTIGIYGTGAHTTHLLRMYSALLGGIKAKIIYIDSNKETDTSIYNYQSVYNIKDITGLNLDAILISSRRYEEDMVKNIKEIYGDKYEVIRLYDKYERLFF